MSRVDVTDAGWVKCPVNLLITDLDNTLYDWVGSFVPAMYEMVRVAAVLMHTSEAELLDEIREENQKNRTSERPFSLLSTRSVMRAFGSESGAAARSALDPAFRAFNAERKRRMRLFDGVYESLKQVRSSGVPIVIYTEAEVASALFRIEKLGLWPEVDAIYASVGGWAQHPDRFRQQHYEGMLNSGKVVLLAEGHRKPSPETLASICRAYGVRPAETVYVGDSLTKDVGMAIQAGVIAVWARYGNVAEGDAWRKLVRISHWTQEDVQREESLRADFGKIKPEFEIGQFSELLDLFAF